MCFPPDASPPALPEGLADADATTPDAHQSTLTSTDGTEFAVAFAEAERSMGASVVILPDVRGLFRFYSELARTLARAGHHAIVVDYFGRTAGAEERDADFDFMPHISATTPEQVQADIGTAARYLAEQTEVDRTVAMGFCFGGSQTFLSSRNSELPFSGWIGFYGGLDGTRLGVFPSPADCTSDMRGPLLGLFGGVDPSIPPELVERFDSGLTAAGVEHEVVTYDGAPHSFFDRAHTAHEEACADAWRRVIAFLR